MLYLIKTIINIASIDSQSFVLVKFSVLLRKILWIKRFVGLLFSDKESLFLFAIVIISYELLFCNNNIPLAIPLVCNSNPTYAIGQMASPLYAIICPLEVVRM